MDPPGGGGAAAADTSSSHGRQEINKRRMPPIYPRVGRPHKPSGQHPGNQADSDKNNGSSEYI
ncbi:MAG: hypothetical protein M0Z65_04610 [Firmicutes bacterium]|nr:hypothetical protein [Bacillota bacterium]